MWRGLRTGIKGIGIGLFLLLLAASPCYSAASWAAFTSVNTEEELPIVTIEEPTAEAESQNSSSGIVPETTSETLSESSEVLQTESETLDLELKATAELVRENGVWLSSENKTMLIDKLESADSKIETLEKASKAKDTEIEQLKGELSDAEKSTGTKAYLMMDGIIGFDDLIPTYGVGLTVGTRIGNHFMVELGADYGIGKFTDGMTISKFSMDNFEFRAGIGWMF